MSRKIISSIRYRVSRQILASLIRINRLTQCGVSKKLMKQPFLLLSLGKESKQRVLGRRNAVRLSAPLERTAASKELFITASPRFEQRFPLFNSILNVFLNRTNRLTTYELRLTTKLAALLFTIYSLLSTLFKFILRLTTYDLRLTLLTFYFLLLTPLSAQLLTPLSHEMNRRVEYEMIKNNQPFFTVLKPYVDTQLRGSSRQDSLNILDSGTKSQELRQIQSSDVILSGVEGASDSSSKPGARNQEPRSNTWFNRKLFYESFIQVDSGDYYLFADPVFEFGVGKEIGGTNTYINTRGFRAGGRLGKHFAFGVDFYENQGRLSSVVANRVDRNRIAPGEGWARKIDTMSFDFAYSSGYMSLAIKNFNIRFAQGRQFIGEGYRSLLLSDASYVYPYLNISWTNKTLLYVWSHMLLQDMDIAYTKKVPPFRRKSATMHLIGLSFKKIQFSLIKQELYKNPDTFDNFKWDLNQLNPMLLPLKRSNKGSILGTNIRFNPIKQITLYNQIVLITPYDQSKKLCFQLGGKVMHEFGDNKLYFQTEYNEIPSLAYISGDRLFNWEHFREPLAHPYGNNFKELIFSGVWNYKHFQLFTQITHAQQLDKSFDQSMAKNALFPYFNDGRMLQFFKAEVSYFIHSKTLMNLTLGFNFRKENLTKSKTELNYIYISFGTRLFNKYYDF